MFNFRRNKPKTGTRLYNKLKSQPDKAFVTDECVCFYSTHLNGVLMIPGNYSKASEEEVNHVVVEGFRKYCARNN